MKIEQHFGKTYLKLLDLLSVKKSLAFLVIDPPNQPVEVAGRVAKLAEQCGFDAVTVGGSVGAQGELLDRTIVSVKENCSLPVILFPGNIATLSNKADAVYFMTMLNSNDPYYLSGAQTAASFPVKRMGLETIPTSYIVIEPGRAVGFVGRAQLVPRNLPYLAAATALAGQMMGSHLVILESGGGAPEPAPKEMVSAVKSALDVPLVVAGGVRSEQFAFETIKAGADIVHIGSALEKARNNLDDAKKIMQSLINGVKKGAKERK